jgi:hypothetical protein
MIDIATILSALGGAGTLKLIEKVVGSYKERHDGSLEDRKADEAARKAEEERLAAARATVVASLQTQVGLLDTRLSSAEGKITNLQDRLGVATTERDEWKSRALECARSVADLERRYRKAMADHSGIIADLERELIHARAELNRVWAHYVEVVGSDPPGIPKPCHAPQVLGEGERAIEHDFLRDKEDALAAKIVAEVAAEVAEHHPPQSQPQPEEPTP